jgi:hypothetical protein
MTAYVLRSRIRIIPSAIHQQTVSALPSVLPDPPSAGFAIRSTQSSSFEPTALIAFRGRLLSSHRRSFLITPAGCNDIGPRIPRFHHVCVQAHADKCCSSSRCTVFPSHCTDVYEILVLFHVLPPLCHPERSEKFASRTPREVEGPRTCLRHSGRLKAFSRVLRRVHGENALTRSFRSQQSRGPSTS